MNDPLPKDLAPLDDPQRLSAFDTALLDRTPDPELERLVAEASRASGFPIALVSLVQFRLLRAKD